MKLTDIFTLILNTDCLVYIPMKNAAKAAKLIKTLMDMVKGNPLYKEAQEVLESLSIKNHDITLENIKINKKPDNDRIIFVGAPNTKIPAETWRIIDKALQENRVITFDYISNADKESKFRQVQPWQLIFDDGNWNLHGLYVVKNARRRYSLEKIKNLKLQMTFSHFQKISISET